MGFQNIIGDIMVQAIGYAAKSKTSLLKSFEFLRKNLTAQDVQIDIQYCGVCHSDVHQARNEWHNTQRNKSWRRRDLWAWSHGHQNSECHGR